MRRWLIVAGLAVATLVAGGAVAALVLAPTGDGTAEQLASGQQALESQQHNQPHSQQPSQPQVTPEQVPGTGVTAIGDSVMLAAATALKQRFPGMYVDAKESRQMSTAPGLIQTMLQQGDLGSVVLLGLGTNGPFDGSILTQIEQELGPSRILLLVNVHEPKPWQDQVNATLAAAVHPPRVCLVDWNAAITPHPELLWHDNIHARPSGAQLYTSLIASALPPQYR